MLAKSSIPNSVSCWFGMLGPRTVVHRELVNRPFLAAYDEHATWFTDLKPAFGASRFLPGLDPV